MPIAQTMRGLVPCARPTHIQPPPRTAVIAISSLDRSTGCWSYNEDVADVRDLVQEWLQLHRWAAAGRLWARGLPVFVRALCGCLPRSCRCGSQPAWRGGRCTAGPLALAAAQCCPVALPPPLWLPCQAGQCAAVRPGRLLWRLLCPQAAQVFQGALAQ